MQKHELSEYVGGWLIGNFKPSVFLTRDFEVSVKRFKAGQTEAAHFQRVATEITVVIEGTISMNDTFYDKDDIVVIEPPEIAAFKSITDSVLVCIKFPSIPDDKVLA